MGFASARKANLTAEIARLEKELSELSNNLSESQVGYKRARIQRLKQELADVDKNKFKDASDKLKQDMNQQDMMAAMAAFQGQKS
jgi:septal ring factor EnvC (AmiA/AmiB activator)